MNVFHSVEQARGLEGAAVALGNFDGVHKGHQALFAKARTLGPAAAFTFHPHPGKVLQPELAPKLINTLERKLELLRDQQLSAVILQPFTVDYARTSAAAFEATLFDQLGVANAVVGADFTYGAKRSGTVATLTEAAARRTRAVHVVPAVTVDGVVASSSRIREYILEGRVVAAQRLLGRYFDLDGVVVKGAGRGRTIGFPTANVDTQNELRPGPGVYAVRALIGDDRYIGAANIGVKPTFGGTEVTTEAHLIGFFGDLYGQKLRLQFLERLRPEQRFGSVNELAAQIQRDVEAARTVAARLAD